MLKHLYPYSLSKLIHVHRPKFTVALVRTPQLSPYHARFQVPLNFSKFDLRDYLFHAYNVRAINIRSFVAHSPVRDHIEKPRQFFREEQKKFMTIEMDKPFVWPKEPEDWQPWGKKEKKQSQNDAVEATAGKGNEARLKEVASLRSQARALLDRRSVMDTEREGKRKEKKAPTGIEAWEKMRSEKVIMANEENYKIRV